MRFEEIYGRFHKGHLNCEDAAGLLGISVSSFWRRRRRFAEEGLEGLVDGRLGKASARRVPVDEVTRMLGQPGPWITGLSRPDSWRSLRQVGYPQA